jgi:ribosome-binding factor A
MSTRQEKISRLIQKELADYFQKNSRTFAQGVMISVTSVRISPDLSVAKIFLSIFPSEKTNEAMENIEIHKRAIRAELGNKVRHQLRIIPELNFCIDDSLDYIENIDNLLKE